MQEQSSLGKRQVYNKPVYDQTQIGKVVSTADYAKFGRIGVVFLDYSQPVPVWVVGDIDRTPTEGDMVLVGFIQGRADSPYLAGFVRNESYTSNFVKVEKDKITLQVPTSITDINTHLTDDSLKPTRIVVEVSTLGVFIDGKAVARVGDTVAVSVPTHGTCTGTITSGATR